MGRVILAIALAAAPAVGQEPVAARVKGAIQRGVDWLMKRQAGSGSWGPCTSDSTYDGTVLKGKAGEFYHAGPTSFALFTLAKCGLDKKHTIVKRGLKWLRRKAPRDYEPDKRPRGYSYTAYESSSVILMLTALNEVRTGPRRIQRMPRTKKRGARPPGSRFTPLEWKWLHERVMHLVGGERDVSPLQRAKGGWGYWRNGTYADISSTQFVLLALRAADNAGYPIEARVFYDAARYVRSAQQRGGGFSYQTKGRWSAGMTAAGVASLLICREQFRFENAEMPHGLGGAIKRGLAHMGQHFDASRNVRSSGKRSEHYHYCHLYAIERAASLSRSPRIGEHDWYLRGAEWLLAQQRPDGSWRDSTCMDPQDVLGTCFALLFLKQATPITLTVREKEQKR